MAILVGNVMVSVALGQKQEVETGFSEKCISQSAQPQRSLKLLQGSH